MKKFIVLCLLFFPLVVFAEDYFVSTKVPRWEDFAPKGFVDVKEPKGLGKLNVTAKYWYERRVEFENGLETCNSIENSEEQLSCYDMLKLKQYKKNNEYNAKMEAEIKNASQQLPGMTDRTDTMIPIGGYLEQMTRFMPSEIR